MEQHSEPSSPKEQDRPSLLPSPFPNEPSTVDGETEGYEGERLHEMFLAGKAKRGLYIQHEPSSQSKDPDVNEELSFTQGEEAPKFNPLFTVVEDNITGEQHHPFVHYIFSDDDPEIVTNVLLHTINSNHDVDTTSASVDRNNDESKVRERYILLDMGPDGRTVTSARSLAPDWQVLNYQITTAPTFSESPSEDEAGLMLRIEGRENPKREDIPEQLHKQSVEKEATEEEILESMNRLVEQFHKEMDLLKKVASSDQTYDEIEQPGHNP